SWTDEMREAIRPVSESLHLWSLFQDPPDHTRLRALMAKAFTPRIVEAMRPRIARLVDRMLDGVGRDRSFDLIPLLAHPLPSEVILEMLRIPRADRALCARWSSDVACYLGGAGMPEMDVVTRTRESMHEMRVYFRRHVARCRADPRDDLIHSMIAAE